MTEKWVNVFQVGWGKEVWYVSKFSHKVTAA